MKTFIIFDYHGERKSTIKANSREKAHENYCQGSEFLHRHTFCISDKALNQIKNL